MARPSKQRLAGALLERHGRTFAEELRIDVAKGTPAPLFRLLVASILLSARIGHELAVAAARALQQQGWTTSRMLGDTCAILLDRYGGDLRRLREDAERDPRRERTLLKEFKGIGDVGVDIFFRDAQVASSEL